MMRLLIGIDDTDNKESRGTGFNSRQLAAALEANNLATVTGITRHQLLVHPDIPYTSQNSSACLDVETLSFEKTRDFCRSFMLEIGAVGSDVGLCMVEKDSCSPEIIRWGKEAKSIVLKMEDAYALSAKTGIFLEGLTGTRGGVIGALAAVGLRAAGNDGRFIWLNSSKNLRDIEQGIHQVAALIEYAGIDRIESTGNEIIDPEERVYLNEWARPVLLDHKSVLMVEKITNNNNYEWKCAAKEFVKSISN